VVIPPSYTIAKFKSYVSNYEVSRYYLKGSCPICHEGKSGKSKKRLFYFINDDYLFCHNCGLYWSPYFWLKEVTGMSFKEIKQDVFDYIGEDITITDISFTSNTTEEKIITPTLPGECANLKDSLQMEFYKNDYYVKLAKMYCEKRRLFSAKYAPKTFYFCINDYHHKNRLIIPYYNELGKIESYISRDILGKDNKPKYLLKFNSDKAIFNIDKVDGDYPYIFIFEGAIDAMFVKNGIAISGTTLTSNQQDILQKLYPFHKLVWCFDNYRFEKAEVNKKITNKLKENEMVFLYDNEFENFKDINDYCVKNKIDSVSTESILASSYQGLKGLLLINK